ncbi:MAG: NAD(P)-dependent oxidoreductase [Dehalococcoidia bacterium]
MRVGFVGLGIMGRPMAKNLLKAGFQVTAYNRSPGPREELAEAGADVVTTPREAAEGAEAVITNVTDSPDVEAVILGPDGIVEGAAPGTIVIDMSTISPAVTRRIGAALAERGVKMLDAPVSGGDQGAIAGTLAIMIGGDAADVDKARPLFEAMGQRITHCGPLGAGQTVKLANQVAITGALLGVCEALTFAQKNDVDPAVVIEAISAGAAGSWQLSNLGPRMLKRDFAPGFKVGLMRKDLRLALESAQQQDMVLPGVALVAQLFAGVAAAGLDEEGTQALLKPLEALNRVTVEGAE